jgi:DNA-binding NtrC family response regulator
VEPSKSARILVVEDEAVVALDVEDRLSRLGHTVVGTADTCASALALAADVRPDLVLMDIALRDGPDGIATAEQLRAELGVPVVFVTAFADTETLERAKRVSPHGYIVKPFDERDLRATIEIALYRDGLDRAMRRSHDDLLAVLDVQRAGNVLVDASGRILFANAAAGRILGADSRSLLDLPWPEGLRLSGDARRRVETLLRTDHARRRKVVARLSRHGSGESVVEIEIEDDPRAPERKIFLLADVSELHGLRRLLDEQGHFHDLVGRSEGVQRVVRLIQQVAPTDVTVLIEGETGTGKELVARAIHGESARRKGPFVAVNCAGLSEELAASQLFGHRRGAFTGAVTDATGMFEAARGGTLFLDEIGDLPPRVQTTLLRVLEERTVMRVGETQSRPVDVRIVAAANRELAGEVEAGRFRADLLYRIRIGRIHLPPLRERRVDLSLLVRHFLSEQRAITGRDVQEVSDEAMQALLAYDWPGNIRELKNLLGYAVIHCAGEAIELEDLPPEVLEHAPPVSAADDLPTDERERILAALVRAGGERKGAAVLLGVSRATLYRRMAHFRIGDPLR